MAAVELRAAAKRYGSQTALHPLDLQLVDGETLVLVGPSGSGKSTVLNLVAGLLAASSGEVRVFGEPMGLSAPRSLRHRIGYLIQEGGLFPHLSARENVLLVPKDLGWSRARMDERVRELRDLVRLDEAALARAPGELSGGQRQRAALMRALVTDPDLLLLDEPLGALDPITRHHLQDELKDLFARLGKSVLLVTHDVGEAAFLGHRLALMAAGEVVQVGTADALAGSPASALVRDFLAAHRPVPQPDRSPSPEVAS